MNVSHNIQTKNIRPTRVNSRFEFQILSNVKLLLIKNKHQQIEVQANLLDQNVNELENELSRIYMKQKSGNLRYNTLHIEDFTRARVNESVLTAILVEAGAMPVPTKLQNPTVCG